MILADSAVQIAESWPAVAVYAIITIGGWVTLYLKQRGEGQKVSEVKEQVDVVRDHVANGHHTNLRDDLTEVLRRTGLMESYLRLLPSQQDISGLRTDVQGLSTRMDGLEAKVRRHYPD